MKSTSIIQPASQMEAFRAFPEGTRVELIDNEFFFMPSSPRVSHQRVLAELHIVVTLYVREMSLGEVFFAPCDVYLDEEYNAVQPDLLFIATADSGKVHEDGIHGSPDLIVEVLSPGNKKHDTVRKRELYQRFGVKEYWIIDPAEKMASGFTLVNNNYESIGIFRNKIYSAVLGRSFAF